MAGNLKNVLESKSSFCSGMTNEKRFGDIFGLFLTNSRRFEAELIWKIDFLVFEA